MKRRSHHKADQSGFGTLTVREVVENNSMQATEVWCRKMYRHLLQELERRYAEGLPHQAITPDTVIIRADGVPQLLPGGGDPPRDMVGDLSALAKLLHFAITRQDVASASLRGRALQGYSDSVIAAIDRCLAPEPCQRPRTIDEVREILGIVALKGITPLPTYNRPLHPRTRQEHALPRRQAPLAAAGRRLFMSRGPGLVVAAALALLLHPAGLAPSVHTVGAPAQKRIVKTEANKSPAPFTVPTLPGHVFGPSANGKDPGKRDSGSAPGPVPPERRPHDSAGKPALPRGQTASPARLRGAAPMPPASASASAPPGGSGNKAIQASNPGTAKATEPAADIILLELHIAPWGVVHVDGVESGLSPPMKRLAVKTGHHSVQVTNSHSGSRVLEINTNKGDRAIYVDFDNDDDSSERFPINPS